LILKSFPLNALIINSLLLMLFEAGSAITPFKILSGLLMTIDFIDRKLERHTTLTGSPTLSGW
jgi:hypothetical protein